MEREFSTGFGYLWGKREGVCELMMRLAVGLRLARMSRLWLEENCLFMVIAVLFLGLESNMII